MLSDQNIKEIKHELRVLEKEHAELDSLVKLEWNRLDEVALQRVKKRKLYIKDRIAEIRSTIFPNIIA